MSKQWVRQEIKRNELAERLETVAGKVQANQQLTLAIAGGTLAVAIVGGLAWAHISKNRTEAWEKLAIAHTYDYQGQLKPALEQLQAVIDGPAKPGGYAMLFAGDLRFKAGEYKEAADAYQRLIDRQGPPQLLPIAMASQGLALEAAGDCKASIEANQRYVESYQDHFMAPQAHGSLARCQLALAQGPQAKATLDRIALLYPDTYWAQWAKEKLNPAAARPAPPPQPPVPAPAKARAPQAPKPATAAPPQAAPALAAPAAQPAPAAPAPAPPAAQPPAAPAQTPPGQP